MNLARTAATLCAAAALWLAAGNAGAEQPCVLDKCLNGGAPAAPAPGRVPAPRPQADTPDDTALPPPPRRRYGGNNGYGGRSGGGGAPGSFDFYVLTLSWSSGFCETGGDDKGKAQCDAGSGLGFVVHGLWPQYEHGFPSNCGSGEVSRIALNEARGLFPDEGLARYEWSKHGTCSGKNAQAYFADVRRAREAITIPEDYRQPAGEQSVAPIDIARAFISANSGLRLNALAVACKSQTLQEVRICFSKDLREFHACPEVTRGACRTREIRVPPVR